MHDKIIIIIKFQAKISYKFVPAKLQWEIKNNLPGSSMHYNIKDKGKTLPHLFRFPYKEIIESFPRQYFE